MKGSSEQSRKQTKGEKRRKWRAYVYHKMAGYSLDKGRTRHDWERLAISGIRRREERAMVGEFAVSH